MKTVFSCSVFFLTVLLLMVTSPLGAAGTVTDQEVYEFRRRRLEPADHAGFLKLGIWCEERKLMREARNCFEKAIQSGRSASYADAGFRLARIELSLDKVASAFARLRELVSLYGHKEAGRLLSEAEQKILEKQKELIAQAEEHLKQGLYLRAKKRFREAAAIIPEQHAATPYIPEKTIMSRIIACRKAHDKNYRYLEAKELASKVRSCPDCGNNYLPGFIPCPVCKGGARRSRCRHCNGQGWLVCPTCSGAGKALDPASPSVRKLIISIQRSIQTSLSQSENLTGSAGKIESILHSASSKELMLLCRLAPGTKAIDVLWDLIPGVPFSGRMVQVERTWRELDEDRRIKPAFLFSFACRYARYLSERDLFRELERPLLRKPDLATGEGIERVPLQELAAFPENHAGDFAVVHGTIGKITPHGGFVTATIEELDEGDLLLCAWGNKAQQEYRDLSRTPWGRKIGRLHLEYPFDAAQHLAALPKQWVAAFTGRLLRNRLKTPSCFFEVWKCEPLYPVSQKTLVAHLEKPVRIVLRDVTLQELFSVIDTLCGLKVGCKGVPLSTALNLMAEGCTLGRLLDKLAAILDLDFYLHDGRVMLEPDGSVGAVRDTASLVAYLKKIDKAPMTLSKSDNKVVPPTPPSPPGVITDPIQALKHALASMNYVDAVMHSQAARFSPETAESTKKALKKYTVFARLGALVAGALPVSTFVGKDRISKIRLRDRTGEEKELLVVVLERKSDGVLLQTSFGTTFFLPAVQLVGEEEIETSSWRGRRRRQIEERISAAEAYKGRQRSGELFSIMVLAKTSGVFEKGNEVMKKLVASPGFPWVVETFFPDKTKACLELWRQLGFKRRKEPEPPPVDIADTGAAPDEAPEGGEKQHGASEQVSLPSEREELIVFALRHLNDAKEHRRRSLPGNKNFKEELKEAVHHLQLARKGFRVLLEQEDDAEIREKLSETIMLLHGCVKDMPFF